MDVRTLAAIVVALVAASQVAYAPDPNDFIENLPNVTFTVNFAHYSGFLDAGEDRHLHYWYVESQSDPATDPLILWLNGGPGCSSLFGLLGELGPYRFDGVTDTLLPNPYAWNTVANVLFLESPVGVGYSYADSGETATNDDLVAEQNYQALESFVVKFPELTGRDFYITGESFAGIYVPTLVDRIINSTLRERLNLKTFFIANGVHNYNFNDNSELFFLGYHGLIDSVGRQKIGSACCESGRFEPTCQIVDNPMIACYVAFEEAFITSIDDSTFDPYNLYNDCIPPTRLLTDLQWRFKKHPKIQKAMIKKALERRQNKDATSQYCFDDAGLEEYLNRADVRQALNIPDTVGYWVQCQGLGYTDVYENMNDQYARITQTDIKAVLYHGDVDTVCNFLGGEFFVDQLGLPLDQEFSSYLSNGLTSGFLKLFRNVTYATVWGSGHMVPADKPTVALDLLQWVMEGQPLRTSGKHLLLRP